MSSSDINERIRAIIDSLTKLHNLLTTQLSKDLTESKARVMAISGNNFLDQSLQDALDNNQVLTDIVLNEVVLDDLGEDSFDADYFNGLNTVGDIDAGTLRMRARNQLPTDLTDMHLVLTDKNVKRDAVIGFFFNGESSGNVTACVKFQNLRKPNDSQNTNGTLLTGNWDKSDYFIDLTLRLAGTEEALRIKTTDSTSFVFDYDKDEKNWSTNTAFANTSITVPTTDQQCKDWIASL